MRAQLIYMPLVDEGTNVWRPVAAEQVGPNVFQILGSQPSDEEWQFESGSVVRVSLKTFSGGQTGLVAVELFKA